MPPSFPAAIGRVQQAGSAKAVTGAPSLVETLLALAVIVLMLPGFQRPADGANARERRFGDESLRVVGLPGPVLPGLCAEVGALAEPALRDRLCDGVRLRAQATLPDRLPAALADARARADKAFLAPLDQAAARQAALRTRSADGTEGLRDGADGLAAIEADSAPYIDRFRLDPAHQRGPAPLACAASLVEASLGGASPAAGADDGQRLRRANALLLLAAAFDGHPAAAPLAFGAVLPLAADGACDPSGIAGAVAAAASLMADARLSLLVAQKDEAMRELLATAGWQWAGWMLLGLVLLKASRRLGPAVGVAASLALWAVAAWVSRVPWPLAGTHGFEPARAGPSLASPPAAFVVAMAVAAALLFGWHAMQRAAAPPRPQTLSSRLAYPGLVAATGLGWILLLDLSAYGYAGNRYLALYHQGHLWLAMLVFSLLLFVRQPLARGLAWGLSLSGEAARRVGQRLGTWPSLLLVLVFGAGVVGVFGIALVNKRQLTSELGRLWLIVGAAWFFYLRAGPLAQRLARRGEAAGSVWRYLWPLLFVVAVLAGAMFATRDMGPLLIVAYGSGAFLAASLAAWWQQRSGATGWAMLLAVVAFAGWVAGTTLLLFAVGAVDSVTASRLESLAAPFASTNDQLALVSWFQHAAPAGGFGLGAVPWCGYAALGRCSGVPAQIHSDYTFTAIAGVFGMSVAWTASLATAWWLHRLIRHHGRASRGEPRLLPSSRRIVSDGQAFLSWLCVAWVVLALCQLAVTVAGNLAVLPLTGVTFPFVSFGMTSLVSGMAFLALSINLDLPPGPGHG